MYLKELLDVAYLADAGTEVETVVTLLPAGLLPWTTKSMVVDKQAFESCYLQAKQVAPDAEPVFDAIMDGNNRRFKREFAEFESIKTKYLELCDSAPGEHPASDSVPKELKARTLLGGSNRAKTEKVMELLLQGKSKDSASPEVQDASGAIVDLGGFEMPPLPVEAVAEVSAEVPAELSAGAPVELPVQPVAEVPAEAAVSAEISTESTVASVPVSLDGFELPAEPVEEGAVAEPVAEVEGQLVIEDTAPEASPVAPVAPVAESTDDDEYVFGGMTAAAPVVPDVSHIKPAEEDDEYYSLGGGVTPVSETSPLAGAGTDGEEDDEFVHFGNGNSVGGIVPTVPVGAPVVEEDAGEDEEFMHLGNGSVAESQVTEESEKPLTSESSEASVTEETEKSVVPEVPEMPEASVTEETEKPVVPEVPEVPVTEGDDKSMLPEGCVTVSEAEVVSADTSKEDADRVAALAAMGFGPTESEPEPESVLSPQDAMMVLIAKLRNGEELPADVDEITAAVTGNFADLSGDFRDVLADVEVADIFEGNGVSAIDFFESLCKLTYTPDILQNNCVVPEASEQFMQLLEECSYEALIWVANGSSVMADRIYTQFANLIYEE